MVALVFLTVGVAGGAGNLGIHDRATAVVFTLAWMSAAIIRLSDFRRGRRPAVRIDQLNPRHGAVLLLGVAPWPLLRLVGHVYPAATFWAPIELGLPVEMIGAAVGIYVIVAPLLTRYACCGTAFAVDFQLPGIILRSAALLFITGSPVFAVLSVLWIAAAVWIAPADVAARAAIAPDAPIIPPCSPARCSLSVSSTA